MTEITPEMILMAHDVMLPVAQKLGIQHLGPFDRLPPEVQDKIRSLLTGLSDDDFTPVYEEDVNGDGDTDVSKLDTTGDGEVDTIAVTADSKKEEKDADKLAQDIAGDEITSTGKTDDELDDDGNEDVSVCAFESKPKDYKADWNELLKMLVPGLPGFHGNI